MHYYAPDYANIIWTPWKMAGYYNHAKLQLKICARVGKVSGMPICVRAL